MGAGLKDQTLSTTFQARIRITQATTEDMLWGRTLLVLLWVATRATHGKSYGEVPAGFVRNSDGQDAPAGSPPTINTEDSQGDVGHEALRAYNCQDKPLYLPISLLHPQSCPDPVRDYHPEETIRAQILQAETNYPMTAYQCSVTISRRVTRCGHDSLTYATKTTVYKQALEVTPQACRDAVASREIVVEQQRIPVVIGKLTSEVWHSRGSVEALSGACEVEASFQSGDHQVEKSYEETMADVMVKVVRGAYDVSSGVVTFTNGLAARAMDGVVRDGELGMMVWSAPEPSCEDTVSEIYLGPVQIHRRQDQKGDHEAIVLVADNATEQYAGLQLRAPKRICQTHCFSTQATGIVICLLREMDGPLQNVAFQASADQAMARMQTQLSFLHIGTNMRTYDRFAVVQKDLCEVEHKLLTARLHRIASQGDPYALLDLFGPGHDLYRAGAVVYLVRCRAVSVRRISYANCTQEVPVNLTVNNASITRFMDPINRVLREFPTILPCSPVTPVMWRIAGDWVAVDPFIRTGVKAPIRLPTSTTPFTDDDWAKGMGEGLYSPDQISAHRQFQATYAARIPVAAKAAAAATSHHQLIGPEMRLGSLLDGSDMANIVNHVGMSLVPMFWLLGSTYNVVVGTILFAGIVKGVLGVVLRIISMYRQKGCGWWLVAAVWSTTYHLLALPWKVVDLAARALEGDEPPTNRRPPAPGTPGTRIRRSSSQQGPSSPYEMSTRRRPYRPLIHALERQRAAEAAQDWRDAAACGSRRFNNVPLDTEDDGDSDVFDRFGSRRRRRSHRRSASEGAASCRRRTPGPPAASLNYETLQPRTVPVASDATTKESDEDR